MDVHIGLDIILGISCSALGWWTRVMWDAQSRLQRDLANLERALPDIYVRRDDFNTFVERILGRFDRLEDKIDKINERALHHAE